MKVWLRDVLELGIEMNNSRMYDGLPRHANPGVYDCFGIDTPWFMFRWYADDRTGNQWIRWGVI